MDKSKLWIAGVAFLICGTIVASAGYRFLSFALSIPVGGNGTPKEIFYEVKPHLNAMRIADDLERAGIVTDARLFYWYARLTGKSAKLKAGDYRFTDHMTPGEVAAILMSGISYGMPMTVPEGYNMKQVAEIFNGLRPGEGERFLELCQDPAFIATLGFSAPPPSTLEGYLFPETYLVGRKMPVEEAIRAMVRKYRAVFTPELVQRARELRLTEHQVVTLASIIEKETGFKKDRPLISSVFHNRLKKHMKLQSDPTVIYGMRDFNGKIGRKGLSTPTPYNTYTIPALPPGPIANPGKEAILAALYPPESNYLYFVSHNDGTTEFSATYDQHRKAVAKYQLDPRAREGRSWRDLYKKEHQSAN